jgi:hypothetical protein
VQTDQTEKTLLKCHFFSATNTICTDPGAIPAFRDERPATNRLSHGTALAFSLKNLDSIGGSVIETNSF